MPTPRAACRRPSAPAAAACSHGGQDGNSSERSVARAWAKAHGGQISDVTYRDNSLRILAIGLLTLDQVTGLRPDLDAAGLGDVDVLVTLVAGGTKELPGKP